MPVRQTGWKPVPPKTAGTEARPTNLFMLYGWADRLMSNCLEKFMSWKSGQDVSPTNCFVQDERAETSGATALECFYIGGTGFPACAQESD